MKNLTKKVAVVTGAARGIGKSIATRLVKEGAVVVLADINPLVEKTSKEIMQEVKDSYCFGKVIDISLSNEVDNLIEEVVEKLGKLDIMINNAGVNQKMAKLEETSDDVFDKIMNINFRGVFNCSRAATWQMVKQGHGGHIINIASFCLIFLPHTSHNI